MNVSLNENKRLFITTILDQNSDPNFIAKFMKKKKKKKSQSKETWKCQAALADIFQVFLVV